MSDYTKKRSYDEVDNADLYEDQNDLVNAVISVLATPESKTAVADIYANDKNHATEIQAYAKIAGNSWTYYVKDLHINIGRNTDNQPAKSLEEHVEIDLGPAKVVSRKHAQIVFNQDTRIWELIVIGRNGAKVDGVKVSSSSATPLSSGAVIDIGGTQMMFILPDATPKISPTILTLLGSKLPKPKSRRIQEYPPTSSSTNGYFWSEPKEIAPPSNTQKLKAFQMFNSENASNIVMNNNNGGASINGGGIGLGSGMPPGSSTMDNDLSKDDAREIKPPYSYATMITQAILSNPEGVLSLSEIYDWIAQHYAFYRFSKSGWQNSIRHNLSLNKAFEKVPRRANEPGKGMKWQISDSYKHEFLKKFQSGSLSKVRRGSSVSRQLQLHLAMHNDLPSQSPRQGNTPIAMPSYQVPQSSGGQLPQIQQHRRQTSQEALQFLAGANSTGQYPPQPFPQYVPTQLPPLQQQQQQQHQQQQQQPLPLPQPTQSQPYQHSRVSSAGSASGFPAASFPPHVQALPYPPQPHQQKSHSSSNIPSSSVPEQSINAKRSLNDIRPVTQGSVISTDRTEIKPSSAPDESSEPTTQLSSPVRADKENTTPPKQYPLYYSKNNNANKDDLHNTTETKNDTNNSNLEFGMITSPTKTFSVSAVEAYTPERGARKKSQDNGNGNSNNANNNGNQPGGPNNLQSSPALWNFVQFSTPLQPGQNMREQPQSQEKSGQLTPTKGGFLPDSPLNLKNEAKDLGDLRNVDLAKGFKK